MSCPGHCTTPISSTMILQFLVSFGFQAERKDWVPSCRVYQPCLLNDITFNEFALSQLQLQLLSIFIVCLQFFTDKEPDCTWQIIYKDLLIPPMFRSPLRNTPVSGCGCGYVNVYFYSVLLHFPCLRILSVREQRHEMIQLVTKRDMKRVCVRWHCLIIEIE